MVETKRGKILLGIGLMLPMLIVFHYLEFYSFAWGVIKYIIEDFGAMFSIDDIVPALKSFGVIASVGVGFGGCLILYNTLWGKRN